VWKWTHREGGDREGGGRGGGGGGAGGGHAGRAGGVNRRGQPSSYLRSARPDRETFFFFRLMDFWRMSFALLDVLFKSISFCDIFLIIIPYVIDIMTIGTKNILTNIPV
jgi:hypothetical protein